MFTITEYAAVNVSVTLAPPGIVNEFHEGTVEPTVGLVVLGRVAGGAPPKTTEVVPLKVIVPAVGVGKLSVMVTPAGQFLCRSLMKKNISFIR